MAVTWPGGLTTEQWKAMTAEAFKNYGPAYREALEAAGGSSTAPVPIEKAREIIAKYQYRPPSISKTASFAGIKPPSVSIGAGKIDIPMTQNELTSLALHNEQATCQGEMQYANTYKIQGWDEGHNWVSLTVQATDKGMAEKKASAAGYDVKQVTRQIGESRTGEQATSSVDPIKEYLEDKGATWKDEYKVGDGYDLVRLLDDSLQTGAKFRPYDLENLFGADTVKQAYAVLPQFRAYETLQDYTVDVPATNWKFVDGKYIPTKPYAESATELRVGQLIADNGIDKTVKLLTQAGVDDAAIFVNSYNDMPPQWRLYADEYGTTALQRRVDMSADVLKSYKQPDGSYDIYGALLAPDDWGEAARNQDAISFLFGSNVTAEALENLRTMRVEVTAPNPIPEGIENKGGVASWFKTVKELLTPWEEEKGQSFIEWMQRPGTMIGDIRRKLTKDEDFRRWYDAQGYPDLVYGYGPMISSAGVGIAQVATTYWRAPANVIIKLGTKIPGLMRVPLLRGIPQMAATAVRMVTIGVPVTYSAAYIAEKVKDVDLQRKWNIFDNLPEKEKDVWAAKAGYKKWEGLDEAQQSAVLGVYAVPTDYTTTEWSGALGEYIEKLVELGNRGSDWLLGQQSPVPEIQQASIGGNAVNYVGAFGLGTGVGLAEGVMYMGAIPLVLTNIFLRVPTGEAWGYTKWIASGMMEFFGQVPATFLSGPFGAGRMIGLFVLSPETLYKTGKGVATSLRPTYIPERGMAMRLNTIRVLFTAQQMDLLSNMSSAELKLLGTRIAATLMGGKDFVKGFGRIKLEVKTVPYQKVVGNALWHFTPDISPFLKGEKVPIVGKLYTSPQAAMSAGVQSLVGGIKAIKPGLVEVRVPSGYTIKGAPIEKLLASGRAVEIEAPLKGSLDPIPGLTGKGVSSNVYFGKYPIRRFTLEGVDTPIVKLSPRKLLQIRALAMKEAVGDFLLGWGGRLEAVKKDLASNKQLKQTLTNIDSSIKSIKQSPDSVVTGGKITSQIEFTHPSGGKVNEKVRGLIIDKDGRVLFTRDRADPVNVYDAVGGSVNVKEVLIPELGKWNYELPKGQRPAVTWELAFRSQAFGELNMVIRKTTDLGMYRGKVGEHSVYGARMFEGRVDSPYFDRVTAWKKYQQPTYKYAEPEIANAFWWNGKSTLKVSVQPWFYDMLAAVAKKYGWDMSKVKVSNVSGKFLRDTSFPDRVMRNKNPDLSSAVRKAAEIEALKTTYGRIMMPSVRDYLLRGGADVVLMTELIKGRRQAVRWLSTQPSDFGKAGDSLVKTLESLRTKIQKMAEDVYKTEYGMLGLTKRELLSRLDPTNLVRALERYRANKTKANSTKLANEIEKLNQVQTKMFDRWLMESNIKEYLDYGVISGRYSTYYDRLARIGAAQSLETAPIWKDMPELEYTDLPSVEYAIKYASQPYRESIFTYTTPYSVPSYAELSAYPNYAEQPQYKNVADYGKPVKYVPTTYKTPPKLTIDKPYVYPPYPPEPPYPPRPPLPPVPKQKVVIIETESKKYAKLPQGSIAWRQGSRRHGTQLRAQWYYIPPPWDQPKPISLDYPPLGAKFTGAATPQETIQMIGKSKAKVPKSASIDLGVVDIIIDDYGQKISFKGKGLETVAGQRLSSATVGMSVPASGIMKVKGHKKSRKLVQSVSAV